MWQIIEKYKNKQKARKATPILGYSETFKSLIKNITYKHTRKKLRGLKNDFKRQAKLSSIEENEGIGRK